MGLEKLISFVQCSNKVANRQEITDDYEKEKTNFLKRGGNLITNKLKKLIEDYFFGTDCLMYYAKIKGSRSDACFRTVKAARLELEEKLANKKEMEKSVNEFKSNQVFIYCHGMRVIGLNYTIFALIYIGFFAVGYYLSYRYETLDRYYNILKFISWTLVIFAITLGKAVLFSLSSTAKWKHLNNYRLFKKMETSKINYRLFEKMRI